MEKERLRFCIDRFDHYYDSINNKSSVFLALGTFILGGLLACFPWLRQNVFDSFWLYFFLVFSILTDFIAIIVVLMATLPHLSDHNSSMFYFNSITKMGEKAFIKNSIELNEDKELSDLRIQVHCLASGLSKKFSRLKIAGILYTITFSLLILLFILISENIKTIKL